MAGSAGGGRKYALTSDEDESDFWGFAQEARGLFTSSEDGLRQVELLGCLPQGTLLKCIDHLGGRRASAGSADVAFLDAQGVEMGSYFVTGVTVTAAEPSLHGEGLLDVTVRLWCDQLLPGSAWVWELLRTGRLSRKGLWHSLDAEGRIAWLSVALWSRRYQRRERPEDTAPGQVFTLDGRQVVDAAGFYCALGEAINGPGGYFGWNLAAVDDCLRGGFGAAAPFTLAWENSDIARSRMVGDRASDRRAGADFGVLQEIFADHGIDVLLR
ncbi:barstar family protein [Streptomyces parvulus]|uniref:barstar family protein n=1 Tax=Streptomyces parvulus TaxID=146923 RepID=UPI001CFBADC2|nr:barstar family protein [Streptomyces parvulus]